MSGSVEDGGEPPPEGGAESEAGLPEEKPAGRRRLRRRLFGLRSRDVEEEMAARAAEIAELRRDVAALRLAFGQREQTIRQLLEAVEPAEAVEHDAPGGGERDTASGPRTQPEPAPATPRAGAEPEPRPAAASIGDQLGDLDEMLAEIERATSALERAYADGTFAGGTGGEEGTPEHERAAPGPTAAEQRAATGEEGSRGAG